MAVKVIEMAGMVGAGKTTLARELADDLGAKGFRVLTVDEAIDEVLARSPIPPVGVAFRRLSPDLRRRALTAIYKLALRPWYSLRFAVRHRALTRLAIRAALQTPLPWWHRRTLVALFFRPAAAHLCFEPRLRSHEILVLEEGLLHRAVNLFAWREQIDQRALASYFARVPATDLVVLVTAPLEECRRRTGDRGLPKRLAGHDEATADRFMANAAVIVGAMEGYVRRTERRSVVVDNGGEFETAVTSLRGALGSIGATVRDSAATTPRFVGGVRVPRPRKKLASLRRSGTGIPRDVVDQVLASFGLEVLGEQRRIPGASRADNVVVRTTAGDKLVKRYKATVNAAAVTHEHSVLRHLAGVDFPAPRLTIAPDGATHRETGGRIFSVFDYRPGFFHYHEWLWSPGTHGDLIDLSARALVALHRALEGFTPEGSNPQGFASLDGERPRDVEWHLAALDRARRHARGLAGSSAAGFRTMIDETAGPLEKELRALDVELTAAALPRQVIHGDYGPYNLLFKRGERIIILDFELARFDWRVTDVAKALQQFGANRFGLSPRRMERFVTAYDGRLALEPDEWRLLPSVWLYLTLRRVAVCWDRFRDSGDETWIRAAQRKLELAESIRGAADRLTALQVTGAKRERK